MSSGFLAINNSNQVLVSSDTRNLHFIAKPSVYEVRQSFDTHGGCRIYAYRVTSPVPILPFFTMPNSDFYGVIAIRDVGSNVWEIEVVKSGANAVVPEVYVFADPRASTATETHGMIVNRDDGTPSFDSRLRPLTITGGLTVQQPSNPLTALAYGLDPKNCASNLTDVGISFSPNQYNVYTPTIAPSKPMFSFASVAQAEREATFSTSENECDGISTKGVCGGVERTYYWNSTYWSFYRGGIRRVSNELHAGWIIVAFGCNWNYYKESSIIGIGTGGDSGSGGSWPYSNETLNLSFSPIIIADAARYD